MCGKGRAKGEGGEEGYATGVPTTPLALVMSRIHRLHVREQASLHLVDRCAWGKSPRLEVHAALNDA